MAVLLKISLVPIVVWLASLAGRRWGHAVAGWISGLPLIAGPISVFLAHDPGPQFAAASAAATLQVTGAAGLHCFAYAWAARRFGWLTSLLVAWAAFAAGAAALGAVPLPPQAGFALSVALLALFLAAMPHVAPARGPVAIPGVELAVRIAAAAALAAAVTLGAAVLGPRLSGILLAFPITGSVLPAFTRALYGADATARLIAGFVSGLFAFAVFHFVIATTLGPLGAALAYPLAVLAALVATGVVMRVRRAVWLRRAHGAPGNRAERR
jgi:hypothetical protein